jgi:hypothetical protein
LNELRIYDVSEAELEGIERSGPESVYLNFALSLASTSASFAFSLLTTEIKSQRRFDCFVIVTVICAIAAAILGVLWFREWRHEKSFKNELFEKIRKRIPAPGEQLSSASSAAAAE